MAKKSQKVANCCTHSKTAKKCQRKSDGKVFDLPRRFPRKKCMTRKIRGFTMRSSCSPYRGCK